MKIIYVILAIILVTAFIILIKRSINVKVTHWMLVIYMGLLVISMGIVPFITEALPTKSNDTQINRGSIYDSLRIGDLERIDPKFLKSTNEYPYARKTLRILSNIEHGSPVFVERKNTDDGKINAYVYSTGITIKGFDFSDKLEAPTLEIENENITVYQAGKQEIQISMIDKEFPIRQFTNQKLFSETPIEHGQQMVYLQIPKSLKIENFTTSIIEVKK